MSVNIIDRSGGRTEVPLGNGLALYREAADKKLTFREFVNQKFPTAADAPETFKQMCASAGLRFKHDKETGRPATTLREALAPIPAYDAATSGGQGTYDQLEAVPDSRILFPAAVMEVVEDSLTTGEDSATNAFESIVGMRSTVASKRLEQPVLSYDNPQGAEDSGFQRTAQNSRPPIMLSLKAADTARTIPTGSIGMEISDEAMATGLDFMTKTLTRFTKKNDYAEWVAQIGKLLSGDPDAAVTPMAAGTSALSTFSAQSLDATITAAGTITQEAWLKYLYKDNLQLTVDTIICDFDTALALDNRSGRPTNVQNDSTDRLDIPFSIIYPAFQANVNILVMPAGTFPANTIMGFMSSDAIAKTISSIASYSAIEAQLIKKSTEFRWDRGFITYRMYDDAFSVMTLTVT